MSFTDEYLEEKKKKKKTTVEKTGHSFTDSYLSEREKSQALQEDIAPVRTAPVKTTTKKDEDEERTWFKSGALDDGYQFGDITKTILGTVGDAGIGIAKGIGYLGEGVGDLINYADASISEKLGNQQRADYIRKRTQESVTDIILGGLEKKVDKYSVLGDKSDSVTQGIGQVGAIIATGGIAGAAGLGAVGTTGVTMGLMGASSAGSGMSEAYMGGATDEEAATYGLIKGVVDAGSEMIFGGLGKTVKALGISKGLTSLDDVFAQKLASRITNNVAKNFVEYGVKASAEGVEEVLAGIGSAVGKKLTYMDDKELNALIQDENLMEQFVVGAVTSGIAQSGLVPGMKGGSLKEANETGRDFISGMSQNEQKVVDKVVEDRIAEEEKSGKKLSNKDKNKIYDEVLEEMEKGGISTDTIEEVLGGDTYKSYKDTVDGEDALAKEYEELGKKQNATLAEQTRYAELHEQMKNKDDSKRNQLKSKLSEEVFGLVKGDRLVESYNERARRGQAFEADLTKYDAKQQETIKKAVESGILNNTRRTHEFVDMVAKITADKGVLFDFTNNKKLKEYGFAVEGKTVNGYVTKDGVTLNIDSAKSLNSVTGHEITHVLEGTELYDALQKTVIEYAKTKGDYQSRYDSLTKLYEGIEDADVNAELTADLVGDYLFTDSDFIHNLSTNHRNVFQKIYDEIKYLCKVATAGSKEARELEKVKRAFEKAYRDTSTNVELKPTEAQQTEEVAESNDKYGVIENLLSMDRVNNTFANEIIRDAELSQAFTDITGVTLEGTTEQKRNTIRNTVREHQMRSVENEATAKAVAKQANAEQAMRDGGYTSYIRGIFAKGANVADAKEILRNPDMKAEWESITGKTLPANEKSAIKMIQQTKRNPANIDLPDINAKYSVSDEQATEPSDMIDSDGVVITNAQKQYFGEHGLKDDDGNLLVLYRSADGGRTVWDGRSGDSWAKGIYLTDDMYVARAFASDGRKVGDVLEVYARANNPLVIDAQGNNYMSIPMPKDAPEWLEDSADFYGDLNADKLPITAFENGYDAVIIKNVIEGVGGDPATDVILRDANQIKRTDNTNPTDNPDIRYSISDSDYQDAVNRGDTDTAQKMVDEVAKEAGYVVRGYHGTTNLFTVFDTSKSNIENDWGQGIYASTSLDDVEANYASEDGADLTNRIERLAERMQDWEEYEDMDFDQCLEAARKQLSEGEHAVLRVALRMDNPVIVERGGGGTFFGYESEYDEEADDYSEPSGTLIDVVEAMRNIIYDEYEWASYDADKLDDLYSEAIDYGGMSALELQSAVEDILIDVTDEDGNLASKEILRKALERIGYDGIVDKTVAYKFGELSGRRFGGMRGVTEGTTHYIAFDPKQAKLTDPVTYDDNGNVIPLSKRFNKENPDIRYSLNESSSYAEIMEEQQKLYQRDMSLMERKREATNNPERLQAMDDYSNLFSELRGLLPKKRTGTATQAELDRIEEIKVLRDEQMNRIAELNESLGLNAIAEEEQEIRELRESLRVAADEAWAREGAEKENKAIEKSGSTAPEYFRKKALKAFKTTANFNEAGYMLPDGKLLNFSGGERNHRYRDHREIGEIYEATQGTAALNRFLSDGNIRIMAESPGIDLASGVEPTKEQYAALRKFINSHGTKEGQFFVDFSGTEGNRVGKYAYEGRVNADRVLNDIKYFYQNGEVREQSSIGQFLSLSKKGEQVAPIGKYNVFGKDIALESALTPESAPISEEIAPVYDSYEADRINSLSDADAPPVRKKTPPKESKPTEEKTTTRKELHKGIVDDIKSRFKARGLDFDKVLKDAKNLSTFATVDNIPQRVMEKALGYKEGQILSDITVNKVAQNETEGIKWLNSFTDRKNGLLAQISKQYHIKPGSKESAAAQMYAEGFYVDENNDIIEYGDAELAKDFPDAKVQANIKGLANDQRIRQIYDETLAMINESRTRNAYPEIPRLDNYFLHFRAMDDTFSRLGLPFNPNDIRAKDLPTDLNGVTADLKPGQPYFASAMHRTGKRTSFDLLGGLERYLSSAKNQIYHIDDIQTLRALRNYIADTYGQANGLENLDNMSEEEAQERIKEVYGAHLSTFAKFLNEEANVLAGKTALIDRGLEGIIGRRGITFLNELNKQVGSNMVGLNVSSSLTNFIPVAQTFAKGNKTAFVKAFAQTVAHKVSRRSDGFAENSPVMIRRNGADRFYRTPWQKAGDVGYALMGVVDNISTELIARTKYNELVSKGMDSQKAHYETDKWVSRLMGDRSLGQQPQLYNSKMLGLLTKFQLEVRNQLDSQFYDTIQETKVSNEHIQNELARNAKTATKVASTFFQLAVVQHLFGQAFESVAGYNPAFDIVEVLMTAFGFDDEEDSEDTALDNIEQGFLELLEDLPYASTFLDGGRIPISSALPIAELVKGEDEWGNESSRWKTLGEVAPYYALPTGYGQIKKTVKGLSMFSDDHPIAGSYTASGNLRFPVDDTVGSRIKAGIFGQYASENARDYFDNERSALKEKQIQEFIDVDIPIRDYWEYREGLSGLDKLNEKADYIASLDLPVSKKNILINNQTDRKKPIDLTGYEKYGNFEEFDFATRYPEKYAVLKAEGISVSDYKDNLEESAFIYTDDYSWASDNPAKYTLSKAITDDVSEYKRYTSDLNDIRADKDANGNSISGSAKSKKTDYINSLDLDYGQRIILYRSLFDSKEDKRKYNSDIVDYLNSRDDISYDEMVTILEELDMTVDSDGNVSW